MAKSPTYSDPEVLGAIAGLMLRARRVVEGTISGLHRSPFHGFNVEFAAYREYAPGDDLRRLDWRALGRTDRLYVKQYEQESNLRGHAGDGRQCRLDALRIAARSRSSITKCHAGGLSGDTADRTTGSRSGLCALFDKERRQSASSGGHTVTTRTYHWPARGRLFP